jgi:hypothetical protein
MILMLPYIDDQASATVDTSGEIVVLVGLPPGAHKVRLELADATHKAGSRRLESGGVRGSPEVVPREPWN